MDNIGRPIVPPDGFWRSRLEAVADVYMGVPLSKLPEDLRVYEHLLWQSRPNAVVEVGVQYGGSLLWFRDRLRDLRTYLPGPKPCVIGVDIDASLAVDNLGSHADGIHLIEGDIQDPSVTDQVLEILGGDPHAMVIDDGPHTYDATLIALNTLSALVPLGGFYVVEDTVVDVESLRVSDHWPHGAGRAVNDWMASDRGSNFRVRRDLERYGITCQPGGYLQRVDGQGSGSVSRPGEKGPPADVIGLRRQTASLCGRVATVLRAAERRLDPGGIRRSPT